MRALQNIIQVIYYEKETTVNSDTIQKKKKPTKRISDLFNCPQNEWITWLENIWINSNFTNAYILKGPSTFLYINVCLGVFDDKKTFLVSALGLR